MTLEENALENIRKISRGEKALTVMNKVQFQEFCAVDEAWKDFHELQRVIQRKAQLANAKTVLFWEHIRQSNEVCESASSRGMELGIRKKDGIPVIVEFKPKPQQNLPPFLMGLMQQGPDND